MAPGSPAGGKKFGSEVWLVGGVTFGYVNMSNVSAAKPSNSAALSPQALKSAAKPISFAAAVQKSTKDVVVATLVVKPLVEEFPLERHEFAVAKTMSLSDRVDEAINRMETIPDFGVSPKTEAQNVITSVRHTIHELKSDVSTLKSNLSLMMSTLVLDRKRSEFAAWMTQYMDDRVLEPYRQWSEPNSHPARIRHSEFRENFFYDASHTAEVKAWLSQQLQSLGLSVDFFWRVRGVVNKRNASQHAIPSADQLIEAIQVLLENQDLSEEDVQILQSIV